MTKSSPLLTATQNAAIFACCANFFSTALTSIGVAAFLILFVCLCCTKQREQLNTQNFPKAVAWALLLYIGWQVVGLSYTDASMDYALQNIFTERKLVLILPLVLVFSSVQAKQRFLWAFLVTATVGMLVSFIFFAMSHFWWPGCNSASTICNPAALFRSQASQSIIFAMGACLSFWLSLQQQSKRAQYLLWALAAAFTANVIFLTPGRSGYVAFFVLVVFGFAWWRGAKGLLMGLVAAGLASALAFNFSPAVHKRVMTGVLEVRNVAQSPVETSLGRRITMYETSLEMVKERPWLGIGTGAFKDHFSAIAAKKYTGWRANPFDDPHNQYLFVTIENGLIGLAFFLILLATLLRQCLRGDDYSKLAAACVIAWMATSLTSGHFRTFPEGHLIAFVVGALMVSRVQGASRSRSQEPSACCA